jgi:hypothetical protein
MHSKGVSPFGDLGARSRMSTPSGAHVDALDEQLNQADRLRREQLFSTIKGLLAHIAGPMPGGWRVIDVWESRAAFNQFGKKLKPVLKKIGMQGVRPKIFPLTRFIKS